MIAPGRVELDAATLTWRRCDDPPSDPRMVAVWDPGGTVVFVGAVWKGGAWHYHAGELCPSPSAKWR